MSAFKWRHFAGEVILWAVATIAGFEVMCMFRKGQFRLWVENGGGMEACFVNRLFGLYA